MNERRELWELLVALLAAVNNDDALRAGLHIRSVEMDVPVEIVARHTEVGFRLLVDLPAWRWETGIALQPGRLKAVFIGGDDEQL